MNNLLNTLSDFPFHGLDGIEGIMRGKNNIFAFGPGQCGRHFWIHT